MKIKKSMRVRAKESVKAKKDKTIACVKNQYERYDKWRTTRYLEKINRNPVVTDEDLNIIY